MGKLSLEQFSVADEVYITDGNKKPIGKKQRNLNALNDFNYMILQTTLLWLLSRV